MLKEAGTGFVLVGEVNLKAKGASKVQLQHAIARSAHLLPLVSNGASAMASWLRHRC